MRQAKTNLQKYFLPSSLTQLIYMRQKNTKRSAKCSKNASCFKSQKCQLFQITKMQAVSNPKYCQLFQFKKFPSFLIQKMLAVSNPKNASCFKSQKCKLFQILKMQAVSNPKNASCSDNSVLALHCWTVLQSNLLQGSCRNLTF